MPFEVADYVDFYSSLHHATNLGPDVPARCRAAPAQLAPPAGGLPRPRRNGGPDRRLVAGRAGQRKPPSGSRRASGQRAARHRARGRVRDRGAERPRRAGPDRARARPRVRHGLVNDWSARDVQAWEYQPLGPFLGKSFATSVSRWVVPLAELLARASTPWASGTRAAPVPARGALGVRHPAQVELNGTVVARTNTRHLYWSMAQQIAHLTVNGASLRTGDLLATGTISGPERDERGSLIELSWNGASRSSWRRLHPHLPRGRRRGGAARRAARRGARADRAGRWRLVRRDPFGERECGARRPNVRMVVHHCDPGHATYAPSLPDRLSG